MAKITGIGGVFLNVTGDAKKLLDWYHDVLNLDVSSYGVNFLDPNSLTLITFDSKNEGQTVLNFSVDSLADYLEMLRSKGVKIVQEMQVFDFGKFARIEDALGNQVELSELVEERYRAMVEKEIADYRTQHKA